MKYRAIVRVVSGEHLYLQLLANKSKIRAGDLVVLHVDTVARNNKQNALYWLFCRYVGKETGLTEEEVHEFFKYKFLRKKKIKNGKIIDYVGSTTELEQSEFSEYFDKCNMLAIEYGIDTSAFWKEYEKLGGKDDR